MIETERLILRPYRADDAAELISNANAPDVARMMESIALPFSAADAAARIEARQCDTTRFTFALTEKSTGAMIGEIGAGGGDPNPRLGYFLRTDRWGLGYASEAIRAALGHAFDALGWPAVDADCFDDNPASVRTLEKAGFIRIGTSNCASLAREESASTSLFRLMRPHWATPVLKTARLTLRPYRGSDADRIAVLLNDLEVSRMLSPVAHPYTRDLADEWVSGAKWGVHDVQFALDNGTGLIGAAGINTGQNAQSVIGFWLGREYWGAGMMSEAIAAMIEWAFTVGGIRALSSYAFIDNIASQRVHEKAGFVAGETVEHHSAARGEPIDAISYSLALSDWQDRQ